MCGHTTTRDLTVMEFTNDEGHQMHGFCYSLYTISTSADPGVSVIKHFGETHGNSGGYRLALGTLFLAQ